MTQKYFKSRLKDLLASLEPKLRSCVTDNTIWSDLDKIRDLCYDVMDYCNFEQYNNSITEPPKENEVIFIITEKGESYIGIIKNKLLYTTDEKIINLQSGSVWKEYPHIHPSNFDHLIPKT